MPEYRRKKQYSGIKKPRNTNVPRYWQRYKNLNASVQNLVTLFARNNDSSNPYLLLSKKKNRHPCGCLFSLGRGIRIRTLNDGVRASQSFFKTAYLSHSSDFASLKNLCQLYITSFQQIRMRNCEPYNEVSKQILNPHYLLQQGSASFSD